MNGRTVAHYRITGFIAQEGREIRADLDDHVADGVCDSGNSYLPVARSLTRNVTTITI
jgi:hypothetical protein